MSRAELPLDQIIHGDNCETLTRFPAGSIDLVITSPPYDDLRRYGGHDWDFYGLAWLLKRVLVPGGVLVWIVRDKVEDGGETGSSMRQALHFQELGLRLHDTMIYQKSAASFPDKSRYWQTWEFMFVFSKGRPRVFNPIADRPNVSAGARVGPTYERDDLGRSVARPKRTEARRRELGVRFNVWRYGTGGGQSSSDSIAFGHPAIFPEQLAADHVRSWSDPGDVVLDPFSGSGTTAKQAALLGRHYIGIEAHEPYVELSRERLRSTIPALRVA